MKVGILGGTFDPPHYGHLIIANEVLCSFHLDEIWFMPNQVPPHKEKTKQISNDDRLAMLNLAIEGHPNFKVELIELERPGRSYTYETMKLLKDKYPPHEFYFIIGGDMVEYLPKWYKIDDLVKLVRFIGVNRKTYNHHSSYPILTTEVPTIDISSSLIRTRLMEGKTIRYLTPDRVRDFIKEKHLYGT